MGSGGFPQGAPLDMLEAGGQASNGCIINRMTLNSDQECGGEDACV